MRDRVEREKDNPAGEFLWRMMGSIVGTFCREFGIDTTRTFVKFLANSEDFWEVQKVIEETENKSKYGLKPRPYQRGAHDFMKKCKPTTGEKGK